MNKLILWLATKFVGKKTLTTIGIGLLKHLAEYLGVDIGGETVSIVVDFCLALLTAFFYKVGKVAVANKLEQ